MRGFVAIALLFFLTLGCTSFKTENSQSTQVTVSELSIGDTVEIVTTDAHKTRFTIQAIEDGALIGDEIRVPIEDIRIVAIQRMDTEKTAAAGITMAAIVIGALMIAGTIVFFP